MSADAASFGLILAFGLAFEWVFVALGMVSGNAQAVQNLAFMVLPLKFISRAYVPVGSIPGWLQPVEHQPITYMVDAVRAFTLGPDATAVLGHDARYFVVWSLVWTAAIIAVFAPVGVAWFRRG